MTNRQKAIQMAVEIYKIDSQGNKSDQTVSIKAILLEAEQIYQWISKGTIPPPVARVGGEPKPTQIAPKSTTAPLKAQEDSKPPVARSGGEPSETTIEIPEFKDGTELVNYALKKGIKLAAIQKTLGITKPSDIQDVQTAATVLFATGKLV